MSIVLPFGFVGGFFLHVGAAMGGYEGAYFMLLANRGLHQGGLHRFLR